MLCKRLEEGWLADSVLLSFYCPFYGMGQYHLEKVHYLAQTGKSDLMDVLWIYHRLQSFE